MPAPGRLAFLLPHLRGGGAERVALRLIEDFVDRGHPIDLLLMMEWGELLPLLPPTVRVIDLRARRIRDVVRPLARYLKIERPEGLQAFMWPLTVGAVVAHRLARSTTRLVLSEHTTLSRQYAGLGSIGGLALRWSIAWAYPQAHARVCVSREAARDLATLARLPPESIETIYNPVAAPRVDSHAVATAAGLWPPAAARILTVGSLIAAKNHRLLIDAFAELRRHRDVALIIAGEGPLRAELERYAESAGVGDRVAMLGYVADPAPLYAAADLFVLSSDFEGFSLVLVEAMYGGARIVSTDCESGPREVLDEGTYGRLVPCGDASAMARAMMDALDGPTDPDAARARAEVLSGPDTSDRYLDLMTA